MDSGYKCISLLKCDKNKIKYKSMRPMRSSADPEKNEPLADRPI